MKKIGTTIAPNLPIHLPVNSQWLSGQGGGVWFSISQTEYNDKFIIKRFSSKGKLDCDRLFEIEKVFENKSFDINKEYQFTHISHCAKCTIIQDGVAFVFRCLTT